MTLKQELTVVNFVWNGNYLALYLGSYIPLY